MPKILPALALVALINQGHSQTNSRILSTQESENFLTTEIKSEFDVSYFVYRGYEYNDIDGKQYLFLTEHAYTEGLNQKNDQIKAVQLKVNEKGLSSDWTVEDQINKTSEENSIWFWTKYISLEDLNKDERIDPIIVYGTSALNGTQDGRIIIVVYYNDKQYAINHQNGIADSQRHTQIDEAFYSLPKEIQDQVISIMKGIEENASGIFPNDWQKKMKAHQSEISN